MPATEHLDTLPTSFGALKPVGHVLLAFPSSRSLGVMQTALAEQGWPAGEVTVFAPADAVEDLERLIDNASSLAGFGHEIALMRRYLELAQRGHVWLLVKVDGDDEAGTVGELARRYGASSAVHYRTLTVEDLL